MTAHLPRRPSILIVDDSPGVLQTMEFLLSPHLPVRVADSGQAALAALTVRQDAVLRLVASGEMRAEVAEAIAAQMRALSAQVEVPDA